MSDDDIMRNVP